MTQQSTVVDQTHYFNDIAEQYDAVRGTEIWPSLRETIHAVADTSRTVVDVATGTGLFSVRLAQQGFHVIGVDQNPCMLARAIRKAGREGCPFRGVLGAAEGLPLRSESVSVLLSTNAIHHFRLIAHFEEVVRVLRSGGHYVVYARFREQNARSIWGQLFPGFSEKDTRLYNPEDFQRIPEECSELTLESLEELAFQKPFSHESLLWSARQRKYSTFAMYGEAEFWSAFARFRSRLADFKEDFYVAEIGRLIFRKA